MGIDTKVVNSSRYSILAPIIMIYLGTFVETDEIFAGSIVSKNCTIMSLEVGSMWCRLELPVINLGPNIIDFDLHSVK